MVNDRTQKLVRLDKIDRGNRLRMGPVKIEDMMRSLQQFGLINPVTVADNGDGTFTLIAGDRRRRAAMALGWKEISATVMSPLEAEEHLLYEREENIQRMKFTHAANVEFIRRIKAIEDAKLRIEQTKGLKRGRVRLDQPVQPGSADIDETLMPVCDDRHTRESGRNKFAPSTPPEVTDTEGAFMSVCDDRHTRESGRLLNKLATSAGYQSGRQAARVLHIAELRPDLIKKMDEEGITVNAALRIMEQDKACDQTDSLTVVELDNGTAADDSIQPNSGIKPNTLNKHSAQCEPHNATHAELMQYPVYAALFTDYQNALRTIEQLRAENAALISKYTTTADTEEYTGE